VAGASELIAECSSQRQVAETGCKGSTLEANVAAPWSYNLSASPIEKDEGASAILGHAGFIKTVEDLYEAMAGSVPGVNFGIAFAEASGTCLVRSDGNDNGLKAQAENSILR
jgi:hypothetical protein